MTDLLGALESLALTAVSLFVGGRLGQRLYNRITRDREREDEAMSLDKIGRLPDERTDRAGVDSVLLAQAFWRGDMAAVESILRHCDPYSVSLQLCGFLFATFRQHHVDAEERLGVWLDACRNEIGEPS